MQISAMGVTLTIAQPLPDLRQSCIAVGIGFRAGRRQGDVVV
jgi:hypothetical protein